MNLFNFLMMKNILVILFLFVSFCAFGQYEVTVTNISRSWNDDDPTCTIKSRITFQNNTNKTISSITFWLIVSENEEEEKRIVYKRKHTVNYIIKPEEVVPSPIFTWSCCSATTYNDSCSYKIDVIGYR